jgi:hypothetical protein
MQRFSQRIGVLAVFALAFSGVLASGEAAEADDSIDAARGYPAALTQPQKAWDRFFRGSDSGLKEFGPARSDHLAIALNIGQCYETEIGHPHQWPQSVRDALEIDLDKNPMHWISFDTAHANSPGSQDPKFVLNAFHWAAISFSDRISRARIQFGRELEDSRQSSLWYQRIVLALGAVATILISVRAMVEDKTKLARFVGVLAIVSSAAGASVSSMNAFEGSQAIAARDQRALAQLQQLHWRVASDVLTRPELCRKTSEPPGKAMEVVDAWRTRLEMILDSAVESISKPGDLQGGGGPFQKDVSPMPGSGSGGQQIASQK